MAWIDGGKLPAYKTPGGHRRVLREDLLEFLRTYKMPIPPELRPNKRLLIVDDEPQIVDVVARLARELNPAFEIESAANGFEAGRKLASFRPDLVVLDLMLPGADGFQVCREIRSDEKLRGGKVLAISGFNTEENKRKILSCGADEWLPKPLNPRLLSEALKRLLGARRPPSA